MADQNSNDEEANSSQQRMHDVDIKTCCYKDHPLVKGMKLKCNHRICKSCHEEAMKKRFEQKKPFKCPRCINPKAFELMNDDIPPNLLGLFNKLQKYRDVEAKLHLQHCPSPGCEKLVQVCSDVQGGENSYLGNEPRGVTCECGHSFCVLCNRPKHDGINCEESKEFCRLYDNPNTRRCPECKNILQVWNMMNKKKVECLVCDTKLEPQDKIHLSPLAFTLTYIFMVFILPVYLGRMVYKRLRARWVKDPEIPDDDSLDGIEEISASCTKCLLITAAVLIGILVGIGVTLGGPIFWIIGYIRVCKLHAAQRREQAKFREEFIVKEGAAEP
ncbi:unnamed protein product [Moneuplotes crassus]|uniref:IBR domain-containing protein n=1 Tax=Euplotes crassus TaxID=5936 RepID=A0AAD1U2W3_EUPCR|nr:unnamed protein product [Moneuplotes crassus]